MRLLEFLSQQQQDESSGISTVALSPLKEVQDSDCEKKNCNTGSIRYGDLSPLMIRQKDGGEHQEFHDKCGNSRDSALDRSDPAEYAFLLQDDDDDHSSSLWSYEEFAVVTEAARPGNGCSSVTAAATDGPLVALE